MKKLALLATLIMVSGRVLGADVTVNAKVSNLGLGAEVAFPIAPNFDGRLGMNGGSSKFGDDAFISNNGTATKYDGRAKLQSFSAFVDWHPREDAFRVSSGLIYNNNKFDLNLKPDANGNVNIGDTSYHVGSGQHADASIDFRKVAPYLGIGWGRTPKNKGFSFTSDIGVMYQGKSKTALSSNISGVTQSDLTKAQSDISKDWKCTVCGVVSVGAGYTF